MQDITSEQINDDLNYIFNTLSEEDNRLNYLKILGDTNLILVGPNGSGKSALAAYLKESLSNNVLVVPAQKYLYYDENNIELSHIDKEGFSTIQSINFNQKKTFDNKYSNAYNDRVSNLSNFFHALISLTVNDYIESLHQNQVKANINDNNSLLQNCNYTIFLKLWKTIVPNISWGLDTNKRSIYPIKYGKKYNINDMSDGEKVVAFYLLCVLNAEENSYIIIDEPETFLNPSIYKRVWDLLENLRKDCIFIFISHNVDFITSRHTNELYWCKSYDGENEWSINRIEKENLDLPNKLLTELLGSQVPIFFCEGSKDSFDYKIYSTLFESKALFIPVGGHKKVISSTKAFRSLNNNSNKAYGIIDRDQNNIEKTSEYLKDNIFTLYFNEIEMLYLCEEIIDSVLYDIYTDYEKLKENFINKFFDLLRKRKSKIIDKKIKEIFDSFFENEKVEEGDNTEKIILELSQKIERLDIENHIIQLNNIIDSILDSRNYDEALKLSPFKDLLKEAEKIFGLSNYCDIVITKLYRDKKLRSRILKTYFNDILKKTNVLIDA